MSFLRGQAERLQLVFKVFTSLLSICKGGLTIGVAGYRQFSESGEYGNNMQSYRHHSITSARNGGQSPAAYKRPTFKLQPPYSTGQKFKAFADLPEGFRLSWDCL